MRPRPRPDPVDEDDKLDELIADAIDRSPKVRAAILRIAATARPARKPRPTIVPPRRTGRGT